MAPASNASFTGRLAHYAGSSILLQVFRLGYAYAKPKFLSPALLGLWNLLYLVPTYASHLHLGARTAIVYTIPRLLAEGREAEAADHAATIYRFSLGYSLVLAAGLLVVAALAPFAQETRIGLAAMAGLVMLIWYHEIQYALLKATRKFGLISRANVLNALLLAGVGIPLVWAFGIYGVFAAALLTKGIVVAYLRLNHPLDWRGGFDRRLLGGLIRQGLPIMGFAFGLVLLSTADRIIIGGFLGKEAVGYYAVALVAATFILQIPVAARDMLEPQLMASLATTDSRRVWDDYFLAPLLNTAVHFPLLIGCVAFLAEDILALLLPRYMPSALPAVLLAFGCHFLALIQVMRGILVAHGWQLKALPMQALGLAANVGLGYMLIRQGWGISGVAISTAVSFALVFGLLTLFVLARSPYGRGERIGQLLAMLLPWAATAALVPGLHRLLADVPGPHAALSLVKLGLFAGALLLVALLLKRSHPQIRPLAFRSRR